MAAGAVVTRLIQPPILLATAYVALGSAWLGSNPPYTAADEVPHYLRALSIGHGDFLGEPIDRIHVSPHNAAQAAHLLCTTRSVLVPAGLAVPASWDCTRGNFAVSARCITGAPTNDSPVRQITTEAGTLPYLYISRLDSRCDLPATRRRPCSWDG
jgi:hypothetical protein